MLFIRENPNGIVLQVFIQPRASKDMIAGLHGDRLKIKIAAPPVEGKANKRCIRFLAEHLSVPRSKLEIISGHNSRNKQVLLRFAQTPPSTEEYNDLRRQIQGLIKPRSASKQPGSKGPNGQTG